MRKYIRVTKYGPAINCFSVAAGLKISNQLKVGMLFVLDGDKFCTEEEIEQRIREALTGTAPQHREMRELIRDKITKFNLPEGFAPKRYIHSLLTQLPNEDNNEIISVVIEIEQVNDQHKYIDDIIQRIGYQSKEVELSRVMDVVSRNQSWEEFIQPVKVWLEQQRDWVVRT